MVILFSFCCEIVKIDLNDDGNDIFITQNTLREKLDRSVDSDTAFNAVDMLLNIGEKHDCNRQWIGYSRGFFQTITDPNRLKQTVQDSIFFLETDPQNTLCPLSTTRLSDSAPWRVCLSLFGSVVAGVNIKHFWYFSRL